MKTLLMGLLVAASLTGTAVKAAMSEQPLISIATVKVTEGSEASFKTAAAEILAPTRAEEGNISYEFLQSPTDPTEFATVEVWRSQAAIDKHMQLPHMQAFFGKVGALFAPGYPIIKTYQKFEKQ